MKKKLSWPEAIRDIIIWIVLGWMFCSFASCTVKCQRAKADVFIHNTGQVVW